MSAPAPRVPRAARLAVASTLALALLQILWELALAPLRPHGSWLALKALPLLLLLPGVAHGRRMPRQVLALLLPFYIGEALLRTLAEPGRHAIVAAVACATAGVAFLALLAWFRGETLRQRKHDALDDA